MATSLLPAHSSLDVMVPSDDVMAGTPEAERRSATHRVTGLVTEIGGSAAWLAWQIEAGEVLVHEAKSQIRGIAESLDRYQDRLPAELHASMCAALCVAQAAADRDDLSSVTQSARDIRAMADKYRAKTMAC